MNGELAALLNERSIGIADSPVDSRALAALLDRIEDGTLSGKMAKEVFAHMADTESDVDTIIESKGLRQITDSTQLEQTIDAVLENHPDQIRQYREGNRKVFGYLMGQIMKATDGKANPGQVSELLRDKLG